MKTTTIVLTLVSLVFSFCTCKAGQVVRRNRVRVVKTSKVNVRTWRRVGWRRKGPVIIRRSVTRRSVTAVNPQNSGTNDAPSSPGKAGDTVYDLTYASRSGFDQKYTSLDVYPLEGEGSKVAVFVHGGSWQKGDKSNLEKAPDFVPMFQEMGYAVVSINHRLWPDVTYKEQSEDISSALLWVKENMADYGAACDAVTLMGYSSGAHLVALVGTDHSYIKAVGLDISFIENVICFDCLYDLPRVIETCHSFNYPAAEKNIPEVFGSDSAGLEAASPVYHLAEGMQYPRFLVLWAYDQGGKETELSKDQSEFFVQCLQYVGADAKVDGWYDETHSSLVMELGSAGDEPTKVVKEFLQSK